VAVTNEENSSMPNIADDSIITQCGPKSAILGTKTYLTQLLSLYQILFNIGDVKDSKLILKDIKKLPIIIDNLVRITEDDNRELALKYKDENIFYTLGSGPNYGLAYKLP
jgi:fructoselysine-6-P-deglycase FrlB-like protein